MPRKIRETRAKSVEALKHEEATRRNLPSAEHQPLMREEEQSPVRLAYERRNRDLDPQLVWRGKDEQDWSDLVVNAPPLYIQERVHPKALIDDLMRQSRNGNDSGDYQIDMFADFNGLPSEDARTEFYQHDANWSNRMVLGDSFQVMASLAEREGLRGKVQCIYIDPPYGIRFNSNFQWSTTSRDVRDGNREHITREPEQVKAFRDTWRDGIHSYLTYLRDRLTVARDLLADSGSIFVQIGDENVHRVRALMDEVFGEHNFVSQIMVKKTGGVGATQLDNVFDFLIWYAKSRQDTKYRELFFEKLIGEGQGTGRRYDQVESQPFAERGLHKSEKDNINRLLELERDGARFFQLTALVSESSSASTTFDVQYQGAEYSRTNWKTNYLGMERLAKSDRLRRGDRTLRFKRYLTDFPATVVTNYWDDTGVSGKTYVVQTAARVLERCILMTTDPGDLVLDPTCGSGTTAYVAEQWGRRWITIDTSRVALALARARIMGARYPYYLLADSREGQLKEAEVTRKAPSESPAYGDIRQGFVYERVPHITLRDIANNTEIDVIWETAQEELEPLREKLNRALGTSWEEWDIPRDAEESWTEQAKEYHRKWWERRIARQKKIDASITAKADYEYLYDKPYEGRAKVRVPGPFTVESVSPHRTLEVDEHGDTFDRIAEPGAAYGREYDFAQVILDNLKVSGVQQAHREDRIEFTSLAPWPGRLVCAEGRYMEGGTPEDESSGTERRSAIFVGPEFGTVSRPDLVEAAREAADARFDVLIACAFNYDAHSTEFEKLGRVPVLKARMNADLHMADDLKNTGKANLFVIFGEPDISVASGQWLVARNGRMAANYEHVKELSGLGSLEEINRVSRDGLTSLCEVPGGREVRNNQPNTTGGGVGSGERRGGGGAPRDGGVSPVLGDSERVAGGDGDLSDSGAAVGTDHGRPGQAPDGASFGGRTNARRAKTLLALQGLTKADFPLTLTTSHWSQVTVHGVDVFHPNTGEVRSDGPDGIACWFIDTDYNQEAFFVRHAYFLGASDPYKALKTTLKAEVNAEAWATLHSDISRPFDKPSTGRIAVKIINHLGDEVMKVFRVD